MTCKDCVHYEACESIWEAQGYTVEGTQEGAETACEQFEDKSLYIKLPCKIDTPIYLIHQEKKQRGKPQTFSVHEYDIDHFLVGGTMIPMITACSKENEWAELIDGTQQGYEYFLTREEAEAALKEREK